LKQIFQSLENGETYIADLAVPCVKDGEILIKTNKSLISAGTEKMLKEFGKSNLLEKALNNQDKVKEALSKLKSDGLISTYEAINSKLNNPIPLGYCNVGVIEDIGKGVKGFKIGDRVVSNGYHAEYVSVPMNLCAKIPDNITDNSAVFTVLGAIGLQGIRLAKPSFGEIFVVSGLGIIGLITAQILKANGCKVIGVDPDTKRTKLAASFDIETFNFDNCSNYKNFIDKYSNGNGIDGVIITASTKSNKPIEIASQICRKRGRIILVGISGLKLNRDYFYKKELKFQVSCSYGPGRYDSSYEKFSNDYPIGFVRWTEQRNFDAILSALANKSIRTEELISHKFDIGDSIKAYDLLDSDENHLGILLNYPNKSSSNKYTELKPKKNILINKKIQIDKNISISFIGAGNYASRVLIPAFAKQNIELETLFSRNSIDHLKISKNFKFKNLTTNADDIFKNKSSNTVIIASRHDSHYLYLEKSLKRFKNIFIEKPLCLKLEELNQIENIYNSLLEKGSQPIVMIGFNRRFSPLIKKLKKILELIDDKKSFIYTCNAGYIDPNHWTQDPNIGGGRLIGEACHFVDLLVFLANSKIDKINITSMEDIKYFPDTFTINLKFLDGSIGTIHYYSNGHKSYPKENLEVFSGGSIFKLENFRKLNAWGYPGFKRKTLFVQDKGQLSCVSEFINSIRNSKDSPINFDEIIHIHRKIIEVSQ